MSKLLPFLCAPLFAGCVASMRVQVDSFDRQAYEASEAFTLQRVEGLCTELAYYRSPLFQDRMSRILEGIVRNEMLNLRPAHPELNNDVIDDAVRDFNTHYVGSLTDCLSKFKAEATCTGAGDLDQAQRTGLLKSLTESKMVFLAWERELAIDFAKDLKDIVRPRNRDEEALLDRTAMSLRGAHVAERRDLVCSAFGGSIIADPKQAIVVRASERYWRRHKTTLSIDEAAEEPPSGRRRFGRAKVNRAVVRTFFGNADIAVLMDGPGAFTVKGVRLDADKAIRASFDVLQQGIKYLAYSTGVPVNTPAPEGGGQATTQSIPELAEKDSIRSALEDAQATSDLHMRALMNVLFTSATNSNLRDAAKRKDAVKTIQGAFIVMKEANTTDATAP